MHALLPLGEVVVDVLYCMGPLGCGPTRVELNGKALEFTRRENPYRVGAAELDLSTLMAALQPAENSLTIYTE
jgi:hypothetical protein